MRRCIGSLLRQRTLLFALFAACSLVQCTLAKSDDDDDDDNHKSLFPINGYDIGGVVCVAVAAFLAAGGGLGGGGIFVPVFVVVVGFAAKSAIPLSNVTIFGSAIMNTILNVQKRHPVADRPMIDWDMMLMMQPSTIVGAILGAYINVLLPSLLLVIMLVVMFAYMTFRTIRKARSLYEKETAEKERAATNAAKIQEMVPTRVSTSVNGEHAELAPSADGQPSESAADTEQQAVESLLLHEPALHARAEELMKEEAHVDWRKPVLLAVMLGVVNLITGMASSQFECGSGEYWGLSVVVIPLLFIAVFLISKYLLARHQEKVAVEYPFSSWDVKWDLKSTINCAALCVVAGIMAGMFGIGGGMIQGPLMLELGVHPQATAATSATLILYTSATAAISFWLLGRLELDYAVLFFLVGFIATWGGQLSAQKITEITGRPSFIVVVIAAVITISTCLMTYVGIVELVEDPDSIGRAQGLC